MADRPPTEHTVYELHFIGNRLDPRHGFTIMGAPDIYLRFDTPEGQLDPFRTSIWSLDREVAWFDWTLRGSAPGTVTIVDPPRRFHMHDIAFVTGHPSHSRAFYSASHPTLPSHMFQWLRYARDTYELYTDSWILIGAFRMSPVDEVIDAGPLFASFSYNFHWRDPLLMDAMLALSIHRFLDRFLPAGYPFVLVRKFRKVRQCQRWQSVIIPHWFTIWAIDVRG
ncbi:hypothetical protein BV25DRAFT_1990278 [Artomyces pyxidatus]|uniref:Uncharacterized protein n=1 Tax=Artomyces pyxidatus TaxID=48021 RepID=A0ACB8T5H0_9AGAM|nr:hypothetical protein BV25DRAFT_1990278 [Artomyces pyxidatus]